MEQREKYELLKVHAEKLEALITDGIIHPEKASDICRRIRTELYALLQALKDICVPAPEAGA
jgi:hypothetical protein